MKLHKASPTTICWILVVCFFVYFLLSWILVFRDPRAIIGIGNLYPLLKEPLASTQLLLSHYGLNSIPTIAFAVTSLVAIIYYVKSLSVKISLKKTIIYACIFQLIIFLSFPILSTDIFSYIMSERVSTIHNENIWQVKPSAFPDDQFAVMADWKDTTNVYGGMHYLLYLWPSLLGNNDLLSLVVLYKIIPAVFALGTLYVMYQLLILYKKDNPEFWLRLLFWNPLFILEIFGSGHNDSMMLFFTLLSCYFYKRKLWIVSAIALALAVQVKLIPIVLFVFFLAALVRSKLFKEACIFFAGFLITNGAFFAYMQINILEFLQRVAYNGGVYWQSLPNIMQTFYPVLTGIIPIIFLFWLCIYSAQQFKSKGDPLENYSTVLFVYLLFVSAAYWNWYVLWILPLIPFIKDKKLIFSILILTFTSLLAYPLLWVIHRINSPSQMWSILTYISIFLPVIVVYAVAYFRIKQFMKLSRKLQLELLIAERAQH